MSASRRTSAAIVEVLDEWARENSVPWEKVVLLFKELSCVEGNKSFRDTIQDLCGLVPDRKRPMTYESKTPTPYATVCRGDPEVGHNGCGVVYMTEEFYIRQMDRSDSTWRCARCGYAAQWDDNNYEKYLEQAEERWR